MKTSKLLLSGLLMAALVSCKKEDDTQQQPQPNSETSEDVAMSMTFDEEITNMSQMSLEGDMKGKKSTTWLSCVTFGIDTTGPVTEITLDFGTTNCKGDDGRNRRGKLLITFEDSPFDPGSVVTVTSMGYAINDHEITGSKSITFMGFNADGDPYNTLQTTLAIKKPSGKTITWNSTQERVWVDGFGNLDPKDNAVEVTGNADGTTANGVAFNIDILSPLRVEATCSYIVSGTFELSGPTFATRLFDYGNGSCDRNATVTVNGTTYNISL